jgi:hypothetical protein
MSPGLYSSFQEENIYVRTQSETWQRSGLITADQFRAIHDDTEPQIHQTNLFFRMLFFVFTLLCAGALTGLFAWLMKSAGGTVLAGVLIFFGTIYYIAAEYLVRMRRFYRYGIEEALALMAIVLFCWGCGGLLDKIGVGTKETMIAVSALFALTAFWIYLRFGYLYAVLISVVALGVIPFQLFASPVTERLTLLFILCGIFIFNLIGDKSDVEDFRKERNTTIQACLLAAIYVTINLQILGFIGLLLRDTPIMHLHPELFPPYIYWLSYVLTFIFPIAGICRGIKSRKRLILNVSLVMACVTLTTNKSYLGMTRYAWDPAILGTVLIALFVLITRWLASGPDKRRYGFTAEEILKPEDQGINLAAVAAALTPGAIDAQQPQAPQDKYFEGGASGGGGAQRKF